MALYDGFAVTGNVPQPAQPKKPVKPYVPPKPVAPGSSSSTSSGGLVLPNTNKGFANPNGPKMNLPQTQGSSPLTVGGKTAQQVAGGDLGQSNPYTAGGPGAFPFAIAPDGGLTANQNRAVGVQAKSPNQNLQPKQYDLPSSQTAATNFTGANQATSGGSAQTTGYNAQTGATFGANGVVTSPGNQQQQPQQGLYGSLINELRDTGKGNPNVQKAQQDILDFNTRLNQKYADMEGRGIPLEFVQGREQVLARQAASQQAALSSNYQNALTANQQNIGALGTAAGLAAPQQVSYQTQYTDPTTGLPVGPGGTSGSIATSIQSYAQQVANGQMTRDQAMSALGNNIAFNGQLDQAIKQINPNFNTNSSNAVGSANYQNLFNSFTTTQQHLDGLLASVQKLPLTSIPLINQAINGASGALGSTQYQDYKTKLGVARAEIAKVLGGGSTTVESLNEAQSLLPDNLGPDQLGSAINAAKQLMEEKIKAYGSLGGGQVSTQAGGNTSAGSGGQYDW